MSERERQLEEENQRLRIEVKLLREQVNQLVRKVFGASSEKLDTNQLLLLEAEESARKKDEASACEQPAAEAERLSKSKKKRADRRVRMPEDLPTETIYLDPPEVQAHPEDWRRIGEEVSEQLDYTPGSFKRRLLVRGKYVRRDHRYLAPVIAPLPESLQERSLATPRLLAHITVEKYCQHRPLYRQEDQFWKSHGIWLPRQTLCNWIALVSRWLEPIHRQMKQEVFARKDYLQIDETPIRYLAPGEGRCLQGYLWAYGRSGHDVVFTWSPSRSASVLQEIIPTDFDGVLQSDAYKAYKSFANQRDCGLRLAGCWTHTRRNFVKASPIPAMQWIVRQIALLYRIEESLQRAGPRLRATVRSAASRMILERLHRVLWHWKINRRFLPQSLAGKAIDYALNNWTTLEVFLTGLPPKKRTRNELIFHVRFG